ncbi:hypothetical protein ACFXDH_43450 [Streptomyces sp. NPDC059467]|uniref:hypothetical protein n=1 Tax=Streptomyces sp. NPDC059467 TaxID=3346844 RepID=UPI0036B5A9D1
MTASSPTPDGSSQADGPHSPQPRTTLGLRLRHLVLQTPAPVVARMLGYHDNTTAQLAAEAGGI